MFARHIFLFLALLVSALAQAQTIEDSQSVQQTASADTPELTENGAEKGRWLPMPIIVTEPAIGEGIGASLIYFHRLAQEDETRLLTSESIAHITRRPKPPPTATGIAAVYTNNDTLLYGVGQSRSIRNDKYRVAAGIAHSRLNAALYLLNIPFDFEIEGTVAMANAKRRVGSSDVFWGLGFSVMDATNTFKLSINDEPPVDLVDFDFTNVGLAVSVTYETRDDSMMPTDGQLVELTAWRHDETFGGDFNYTSARLKAHSFHRVARKAVLGLRFDASTVHGSPPYFAVPYVSIRGIPALRYQGDRAGVAEIEGRYEIAPRWALLAFGGIGWTNTTSDAQESENAIRAYGTGFRFQALPDNNVWVGIDIARGPEESAWYVQLGHPW